VSVGHVHGSFSVPEPPPSSSDYEGCLLCYLCRVCLYSVVVDMPGSCFRVSFFGKVVGDGQDTVER
jgi:hypothetical protein